MNNFVVRTLSAIVMLAMFSLAVYKQQMGTLFEVVSACVCYELARTPFHKFVDRKQKLSCYLAAVAIFVSTWASYHDLSASLTQATTGLTLVTASLALVMIVFSLKPETFTVILPEYSMAILAVFLGCKGLRAFADLTRLSTPLSVACFLMVVVNDSFAYFCGKTFGRHKLFALSPSKTVEGFVGGAAFTVAAAAAVAPALVERAGGLAAADSRVYFALIGVAASLVTPFGGFVASAIKRHHGVKDYSNLIPGHGGLTDRFDCQIVMGLVALALYEIILI